MIPAPAAAGKPLLLGVAFASMAERRKTILKLGLGLHSVASRL